MLKNAIKTLKSPQLIAKYEENGRQKAEKEFRKMMAEHSALSMAENLNNQSMN